MAMLKVTVGNRYMGGVVEEFICLNVDISELEEVNYAIDECVGAFVDMHEDFFNDGSEEDQFQILAGCNHWAEEFLDG